MRKRITLLVAAAIMALTMSFGSMAAFADPPLPPGCDKVRGTIVCTEEEEGKNPKFTQEETTTQKGSFQASHEPVTTEECQQDGATREQGCPPGQFR